MLDLNGQEILNITLINVSKLLFNGNFQKLVPQGVIFKLNVENVVNDVISLFIRSLSAFFKFLSII